MRFMLKFGSRITLLPAHLLLATALCFLTLSALPALAEEGPAELLAGKAPVASAGVSHAKQLTDGRVANEGDFWLTNITTRFRDKDAYAIYDLGGPQPIRCVYLQGDNNDFYQVDGSVNGDKFFPMYIGAPASGPGMRMRSGKIVATARFIRVHAHGGDGSYALSELGVLRSCPTPWPPDLVRMQSIQLTQSIKERVGLLAVLSIAFVLFVLGRANRWVSFASALVLLAFAASIATELFGLFPFPDQEPMIRGLVAAIAAALVLRECLLPKLPQVNRIATGALLAVLAVVAVGCYYHFGAAQFWNAKEGRRTYVHSYDMRHYFPVAKYFNELNFDGLYAGSFAAYLELKNQPFESLANQSFRDLRISKMRPAFEMRDHVTEVRSRFSEERWSTFKHDIRFFVDVMGDREFLQNMNDHGGNATPVWLLGAGAILHSVPATEHNLNLMGLIDPAMLALMFFFVGRVFGWRTLGYVLVLFGATDFYQFGSNLMGSMLRQDWLVLLGLGACAFKRERYTLAGGLIAYAGLLRAFPALSALFMLAPALWWLVDQLRTNKRMPTWAELKLAQGPTMRAFVGAAVVVTLLVGTTIAMRGIGSWQSWAEKIRIHEGDVSVNNIGLRNIMAFDPAATGQKLMEARVPDPWGQWDQNFRANLEHRAPIRYALMLAFVGLALLASRGRKPQTAALIGLCLVPVLFYPSNYYLHLIFLLPIALAKVDEELNQARWIFMLCLLCVAQYGTYGWTEGQSDLFFTYQSILLLMTFTLMLIPMAAQGWASLRSVFFRSKF